MELYRFMSIEELKALLGEKTLENNTKHDAKTNSEGFCFMNIKDHDPEYAYQFLSGIVSEDVCVVFETNKKLKKSYGIYADPYGNFFDTITENEYCIDKYNLKDFKILKLAIPDLFKDKWKWETDIQKICNKLYKRKKEKKKIEKEIEEKHKLQNEYKEGKFKELQKYLFNVLESEKIELKIDDKFYKVPFHLTEMEGDIYGYKVNGYFYFKD